MTSQKILALSCAALFAIACGKALSAGHDSESHFLVSCDAGCAEGLSCVCGVCTSPCTDDTSCAGLAGGAICRPQQEADCGGAAPVVACDVDCVADVDCSDLGEAHACRSGRCRAPSPSIGTPNDVELDEAGGTNNPIAGEPSSPAIEPGVPNPPSIPTVPYTPPTFDPANYAACCPGVTLQWNRFTLTPACELDQLGVTATSCPPQLPPCGNPGLDPDEVSAALAHPDVAAAIAEGTTRFGWDGMQNNFAWFAVQIDGALIETGFDCVPVSGSNAPAACAPIPPGIDALENVLRSLEYQQTETSNCEPISDCSAPIDPEPSCSALIDRFAYDAASGSCVQLPAGTGCFSNNLFASLIQCQNICRAF